MADKKQQENNKEQDTEFTGMPNEELPDLESERSKEKAIENSEDNLGNEKEDSSG